MAAGADSSTVGDSESDKQDEKKAEDNDSEVTHNVNKLETVIFQCDSCWCLTVSEQDRNRLYVMFTT